MKFYNEEKKMAKRFPLTPSQGKQADNITQIDEPKDAVPFNNPYTNRTKE